MMGQDNREWHDVIAESRQILIALRTTLLNMKRQSG